MALLNACRLASGVSRKAKLLTSPVSILGSEVLCRPVTTNSDHHGGAGQAAQLATVAATTRDDTTRRRRYIGAAVLIGGDVLVLEDTV